jgi:TRAP-type C4-dicarboxylate transport system substrate-binding protein
VIDAIASEKAMIGEMRLWFSGGYPLHAWCNLPFRLPNQYAYMDAVNDPAVRAILEADLRAHGVTLLGTMPGGAVNTIFSNFELKKVENFKGLKIRATSAETTLTLRTIGAAPLTLAGPEMVEAMARKTVDAAITSLDYGMEQGLGAMVKWINVWQIAPTQSLVFVANAKAFDALPADLKQALLDTAAVVEKMAYYAAETEIAAFNVWVGSAPIKYVYPEAGEVEKALAASKSVIDDWLKVAGPNGQKILDLTAKYTKEGYWKK